MTGECELSCSGCFFCIARNAASASASVGCEVIDTRNRPSVACTAPVPGAPGGGSRVATRCGSGARAEACASGASESGALAAAAGAALRGVADLAGLAGAAAGAGGGAGPASAGSPRTDSVLILRGSLLGKVPLVGIGAGAAASGGGAAVATLAGGGLPFGASGGNTTRGAPLLALMSTGFSSRGTIFSVLSPIGMRSGVLLALSAGAGITLVGVLSALMIGGSPLFGPPR